MRILQVANGFPPVDRGGVESYTLALSKALRALGHDVAVFCREPGGRRPIYSVRDAQTDGIPVRFVTNEFNALTPFASLYHDARIETLFVHWIKEEQPDLVHFQHTHGLSASLIACAAKMGLPFTLTLHDYWYICPQVNLLRPNLSLCPGSHYDVNCYECLYGGKFPPPGAVSPDRRAPLPVEFPQPVELRPLGLSDSIYYPLQKTLPWPVRRMLLGLYDLMRLEIRPRLRQALLSLRKPDLAPLRARAQYMQETLALCKHIIVPLRFVKAQYIDFGVPADQIYVVPLGMEMNHWEGFRPAPRPRGEGLRFGYIGNLLRHKGVDFMIQAFRQLNAPDTELWVHGFELPNSPFSRRLHDLADGDPRIHFTGGYAASDLPCILNQLDVLLIPPLWHETFSFVTREAILAGLPVIASQMGGIPEAVEDGVNGLLLPPGDMDAWVTAMRRVVSDRALVTQFHRAQLTRHVKTMDEHISELSQLYAQIQMSCEKRELK